MNLYKELTLNSQHFKFEELMEFCNGKLMDSSIDVWESNIYSFILEWISESDFVKVMSSGSTGNPKEIILSKNKMISSAIMTGEFFGLKKGNNALLCLPANFIAGKMMIVRSFVLGLNLKYIEPSLALENIPLNIDFAAFIPLQIENLLKTNNLSNFKKIIVGGIAVNPKILSKLKITGTEIYETYGMTETITHVAVRQIYPNMEPYFSALNKIRFGLDNRGCLKIDAPHLSDKIITTNDIVQCINNVTFKFIGRYDNIINSGGLKINPEEVEQMLHDYIKGRFIVSSIHDAKLGEKVVLVIESENTFDFKLDLVKYKFPNLKHEFPKEVYYLNHFPETESGKIDRKSIREKIRNYY